METLKEIKDFRSFMSYKGDGKFMVSTAERSVVVLDDGSIRRIADLKIVCDDVSVDDAIDSISKIHVEDGCSHFIYNVKFYVDHGHPGFKKNKSETLNKIKQHFPEERII